MNDKAEVNLINETILNNLEKDKKAVSRKLTKKGFINVDGNIKRYNPLSSDFVLINQADISAAFTQLLDNTWAVIDDNAINETLTERLPKLTQKDIEDFKQYDIWVNTTIDTELIKDLMNRAIKDNSSFKSDNDFKGKYDLVSQMLILRNNDVFSNGKVLLKLEDDKFTPFKSDKVRELLNKEIVGNGKNIPLQLLKNNYKSYVDNLTDIKQLSELTQMRDKKASILSETKPGYEKVLKVISKYS